MRVRLILLMLFAGLFLRSPAHQEFRLTSEVRLVVLDVSVRDAAGQPVTGLGRDAFRVFDAGAEQPLTGFSGEDSPVTFGVVVDASASMRTRSSEVMAAAAALVQENHPDDEMFLVTFNDDVQAGRLAPPAVLQQAIHGIWMVGRTALYDGVDAGLKSLSQGTHERHVLVVVSDGRDNASRTTRAGVLRELQLAHATVYAIGLRGELDGSMDVGFLREMAQRTGGEAHVNLASGDLPEICRRIARGVRSRYTLAFRGAAVSRPQERRIRVELRAPGAERWKVLVRPSYWALPPQESKP